jgi:hypothetical protein
MTGRTPIASWVLGDPRKRHGTSRSLGNPSERYSWAWNAPHGLTNLGNSLKSQ